MSGQMTNSEIEDVLASIRRLLRDDDPASAADGAAAQRPRRLVLNPDSMVLGDPAATLPRPDVLVLTDPQMGGDAFASGSEADVFEDAVEPSWNAPLILSDPVNLPPPAAPVVSMEAPAPRGARPLLEVRSGLRSGRAASLEDRIAELEAALARDEAEWEADGGDPAVIATADDLRALDDMDDGIDDLAALDGVPVPDAPDGQGAVDATDDAGADRLAASTASDPWASGDALDVPDAHPAAEADHLAAASEPAAPTRPRPRMSEDEVRAWIEAEALRAFGTTLGELVSEDDGRRAVPKALAQDDSASAQGDETAPEALDPGDRDPAPAGPDAVTADAGADTSPEEWPEEWPEAGSEDAPADLPAGGAGSDPDDQRPDFDAQTMLAATTQAANLPSQTASELPPSPPSALAPELAGEIRRIVSDVIRDELRGPLGEELTRSIRRLVRRELALTRDPDEPR
jgi:hypothetical protein